MALADRALRDTRTQFERWIDGLSQSNRKVVDEWLTNSAYPAQGVARWVREDSPEDNFVGYRATVHTVLEWRRAHGIG